MNNAIKSAKKALALLLTAAMTLGLAMTSPVTAVNVKATLTEGKLTVVATNATVTATCDGSSLAVDGSGSLTEGKGISFEITCSDGYELGTDSVVSAASKDASDQGATVVVSAPTLADGKYTCSIEDSAVDATVAGKGIELTVTATEKTYNATITNSGAAAEAGAPTIKYGFAATLADLNAAKSACTNTLTDNKASFKASNFAESKKMFILVEDKDGYETSVTTGGSSRVAAHASIAGVYEVAEKADSKYADVAIAIATAEKEYEVTVTPSTNNADKFIYYLIEIATIIVISIINLFNLSVLNLIVWIIVIIFISYIFYYDESDNALRRIVECEVLFLYIAVCETLGVIFVDWMLCLLKFDIQAGTMQNCLEITFSKVIVIFMYYLAFARLMSKKKGTFTKMHWAINLIILGYSLINMLMIAEGVSQGQANYILTINMGCIVLADLYLLYFIKIANEKNYLEGEIKILEKQANMQYEYYLGQEQKYNATMRILHDVDKHVTGIEQLYANGEIDDANQYVKEIKSMLEPLIPIKYTRNPILDILIADKAAISKEKMIDFDVKVDNVNLDFLEAIDVTTIFGNLIDNAIEAAERVDEDKHIYISISPYQEMVLVRIENASLPLKWKNGIPVSEKGANHGIGLLNVKRSIEKYDGNIAFKQQGDIVTVDLILNS